MKMRTLKSFRVTIPGWFEFRANPSGILIIALPFTNFYGREYLMPLVFFLAFYISPHPCTAIIAQDNVVTVKTQDK